LSGAAMGTAYRTLLLHPPKAAGRISALFKAQVDRWT
jgi:hypothetical protein